MMETYLHICIACEKSFEAKRRGQRTCSVSCRGKLAGATLSKKTCQCGQPVRRGHSSTRCQACALIWKRAQRREFYRRHKDRISGERAERWRTDKEYRIAHLNHIKESRFNGLRVKRLELDQFKCQRCSSPGKLVVHHKKGHDRRTPDRMSRLSDLITLCRTCHMKVHREDLEAKRR